MTGARQGTVVELSARKSPKVTLAERVQALMDARGINQAQLADEIGMSKSVVSAYLGGNYAHHGTIVPALLAWISRAVGREGGLFLETKNAQRVFETCEFAVRERGFVAIIGRPGLGKTVAVREWLRRRLKAREQTLHSHLSPLIRPASLVKMLARRLKVSDIGSAHDVGERVKKELRRQAVPMLFDEANELNWKCLNILRYIWDQTHVPVILAGSIKLDHTLQTVSDRAPELQQLQSRLSTRTLLTSMTQKETQAFVQALFESDELGDEPRAVIREFHARSRGVPRNLANGITSSRELMRVNNQTTLTPELVATAFASRLLVE